MAKVCLMLALAWVLTATTQTQEWIMVCTPDITGGEETCEWKNL